MSKYEDDYIVIVEARNDGVDSCPVFLCSAPVLNFLRSRGELREKSYQGVGELGCEVWETNKPGRFGLKQCLLPILDFTELEFRVAPASEFSSPWGEDIVDIFENLYLSSTLLGGWKDK